MNENKKNIFVIGGCRSGKSGHALKLADEFKQKKIFIATCVPRDEEMKMRIRQHQEERGKNWNPLEIPVKISEAIAEVSSTADIILVDCLTLWVSNLLLESASMDFVMEHAKLLEQAVEKSNCPVIFVSNEVGTGIVPENQIARLFRDAAGFVNQKIARVCDQVVWMVAGIPVTIKG